MDGASQYFIALPQALAGAARTAAATWDASGAASMFHNPTLYRDELSDLYVFAFGSVSDNHAPAIQAALTAHFPGGVMTQADTFEAALSAAGLQRVVVAMP